MSTHKSKQKDLASPLVKSRQEQPENGLSASSTAALPRGKLPFLESELLEGLNSDTVQAELLAAPDGIDSLR
jgi:hypothetical protein